MNEKTILLIDETTNRHAAPVHLNSTSDDAGPAWGQPWSIRFDTLKTGVSAGVDVLSVQLGDVSFEILPTRGMGLWKGTVSGFPLQWNSPVSRPVHPAYVALQDRGRLGWLHGFNELLCRCGMGFNGPPGNDAGKSITLHGRVANLPAHHLRVEISASKQQIQVIGVVEEQSMFGDCFRLETTYTLRSNLAGIEICDRMTNLGGHEAPLSMLYHLNIGEPFLQQGSQVHIPFRALAPRDAQAAKGISTWQTYLPPTPGYAEEAYYFDPIADEQGQSLAVLAPPTGNTGPLALAVKFDKQSLPWLTVWKNTCDVATGYVTGIEPSVNFPNFHSFEREQGRLPLLAPGTSYETRFGLEVYTQQRDVNAALSRVLELQALTPGVIHHFPKPGWSPSAEV